MDLPIPSSKIRCSFSLFSWSLAALVKPVAERVIQQALFYPVITPNRVTAICLILRLNVAVFFCFGTEKALLWGALFYYGVTILDAVDGPLARLTESSSEFGRYFDHASDLFGDSLILSALAFGQGLLLEPLVMGLLFMHIAESYISYLTNIAIKNRIVGTSGFLEGKAGLISLFCEYRNFFFHRNLKSFFSFPDYAVLTFIFFPLMGLPGKGLQIGFYFLLMTTFYTILSSFFSLHTDERRFP